MNFVELFGSARGVRISATMFGFNDGEFLLMVFCLLMDFDRKTFLKCPANGVQILPEHFGRIGLTGFHECLGNLAFRVFQFHFGQNFLHFGVNVGWHIKRRLRWRIVQARWPELKSF